MQQFRNKPPRSGGETREEHLARLREWALQDRLARKAGKLLPPHLMPKLISVPLSTPQQDYELIKDLFDYLLPSPARIDSGS